MQLDKIRSGLLAHRWPVSVTLAFLLIFQIVGISNPVNPAHAQNFDFQINVASTTEFAQPSSGNRYDMQVIPTSGNPEIVTLSVSGPPPGTSYSFNDAPGSNNSFGPTQQVMPPGTARLYVDPSSSAPPGTYTFQLVGTTSSGITRSVMLTLIIQGGTLGGNIQSLSASKSSVKPGETFQITGTVANTGTAYADYHLFTQPSNSVCGGLSDTTSLNPGQTGTISLSCLVPAGVSPGNYNIPVLFEMAYHAQIWQNTQNAGTISTTVEGQSPGAISFVVSNQDDNAVDVKISVDGSWQGSQFGLASGSSITFPDVSVQGDTNHQVSIRWYDPDTGQDYTKDSSVYVSSGQTSTVSFSIDLHAAPVQQLPNLKILSMDINPYSGPYQAGQQVGIYPRIINQGSADANGFSMALYVDGNQVTTQQGINLSSGSLSTGVGFTWTAIAGTHTISVVVDPSNSLQESDKSDNQYSTSISVGQSFDFQISLSPSSRSINAGDSTTFNVQVSSSVGGQPVSLSFDSPNNSITGNFDLPAGTAPFTTNLIINAANNTPSGSFTISVTGNGGGIVHSATATLEVESQNTETQNRQTQSLQSTPPPPPGSISFRTENSRVNVGDRVSLSGSLFPKISTDIDIVFDGPNGINIDRLVSTNSDGNFDYGFYPNIAGTWSITASWNGNENYIGASQHVTVAVSQPEVTTPPTLEMQLISDRTVATGGETISITANVVSNRGGTPNITYAWEANGGYFDNTSSSVVRWTAPTVSSSTTFRIDAEVSAPGYPINIKEVEIVINPSSEQLMQGTSNNQPSTSNNNEENGNSNNQEKPPVPPQAVVSSQNNPIITSVSSVSTSRDQRIVISGNGFGTSSPYNNLDSPYLQLADKSQNWKAGHTDNWVTLNIESWSDSQIIISGFAGHYGNHSWLFDPQWSFSSGDLVEIDVWNPQTGNGPAMFTSVIEQNNESPKNPSEAVTLPSLTNAILQSPLKEQITWFSKNSQDLRQTLGDHVPQWVPLYMADLRQTIADNEVTNFFLPIKDCLEARQLAFAYQVGNTNFAIKAGFCVGGAASVITGSELIVKGLELGGKGVMFVAEVMRNGKEISGISYTTTKILHELDQDTLNHILPKLGQSQLDQQINSLASKGFTHDEIAKIMNQLAKQDHLDDLGQISNLVDQGIPKNAILLAIGKGATPQGISELGDVVGFSVSRDGVIYKFNQDRIYHMFEGSNQELGHFDDISQKFGIQRSQVGEFLKNAIISSNYVGPGDYPSYYVYEYVSDKGKLIIVLNEQKNLIVTAYPRVIS